MKISRSAKSKRVKHYKTRISKAGIASDKEISRIISTELDSQELFGRSPRAVSYREIISDEENQYPDSQYDFI